MKFELNGAKYEIVFKYDFHDTKKWFWHTISDKWPDYMTAENFPYPVEARVQIRVKERRQTVTCSLLRDGRPFIEGVVHVNPKPASKETLRLEALHALMMAVLGWGVSHGYAGIEEARQLRAAMWKAYSERKAKPPVSSAVTDQAAVERS